MSVLFEAVSKPVLTKGWLLDPILVRLTQIGPLFLWGFFAEFSG